MQQPTGNTIETKLIQILDEYFRSIYITTQEVYHNLHNNISFGSGLYDSGFIKDLSIIDRTAFINNFQAILIFYAGGGRYNDYVSYFKALFGQETTVTFDTTADNRVLKVNVGITPKDQFLVTDAGDNIINEEGDKLKVFTLFDTLTETQSLAILELIKPHGIILDITFITI